MESEAKKEPNAPEVQAAIEAKRYSRADLEKYYVWQDESLASFRAKFKVNSNCEALDAIDRLLADRAALAGRLAATGNYVCDREVMPRQVTFANGRTVKIVSNGLEVYLEIGWKQNG